MIDWLREDLPTALLGAAVTLAWLAVIFVPLEWARPRWSSQPRLRRGLATDLAFFAGQHLVFGALVAWILTRIYGLAPLAALADLQGAFARLPMALQVITALILGDLAMYWAHRAQHSFACLWRFHAVHHSSEALDFVAAHREHPVDGLYTQFFMNLPAVLLGFSYEAVLGLVAYGTYDITNLATVRGWALGISLIDLCWGTVVTASAATGGFFVTRWILP